MYVFPDTGCGKVSIASASQILHAKHIRYGMPFRISTDTPPHHKKQNDDHVCGSVHYRDVIDIHLRYEPGLERKQLLFA